MIIHLRKYAMSVFLALALLLPACAPTRVERRQPEPVTLKVLLPPFLNLAPIFIAEKEGYFAEQGLQIESVHLDSFAAAIPALAQGELDVFGGLISIGLLNAVAGGTSIKSVADMGYLDPTGCTSTALMARRALVEAGELDSPAQLEGRRIEVARATTESYYMERLLNTADLKLDDIKTVDLPDPVIPEAFAKGTIDLAATSEPWVTRIAQAGHAVIWMPVEEVIPDFQVGFMLYGPNLLEENPDAGRRFMVAYFKAVQQYNQGKTKRNLELLADFTGLDQELLTQACWPSFRDDGQINVQSVLDFQAWAVEKGYLDHPVTVEKFWDPSFVEHANGVLGTGGQ